METSIFDIQIGPEARDSYWASLESREAGIFDRIARALLRNDGKGGELEALMNDLLSFVLAACGEKEDIVGAAKTILENPLALEQYATQEGHDDAAEWHKGFMGAIWPLGLKDICQAVLCLLSGTVGIILTDAAGAQRQGAPITPEYSECTFCGVVRMIAEDVGGGRGVTAVAQSVQWLAVSGIRENDDALENRNELVARYCTEMKPDKARLRALMAFVQSQGFVDTVKTREVSYEEFLEMCAGRAGIDPPENDG